MKIERFAEGCAYLGLASISTAIICTTGTIPWVLIIVGFIVIYVFV